MGQNSMQEASSKTEIYRDIVIGAITLIALYVTRLDSHHLFHSLAELFSIAVVGGLFAVTWASRGRFLSALFYRINVFGITVPSLRDRIEDIPVLLEEIMQRLAVECRRGTSWCVRMR